jgi:hypothetical protein
VKGVSASHGYETIALYAVRRLSHAASPASRDRVCDGTSSLLFKGKLFPFLTQKMRFPSWALFLLLRVKVYGCHSMVRAVYVFILPFATCHTSLLLAEHLKRVAVGGLSQEGVVFARKRHGLVERELVGR